MEKLQYIVVAGLIKNDHKCLLVYKHTSTSDKCRHKWEIPGGKARFGADFETALREKMREYLGVDVFVIRMLPKTVSIVSHEGDLSKHCYVLVGECELSSDEIKLNHEKLSEYRWVTLKEAEALFDDGLLVEGDLEFIRLGL